MYDVESVRDGGSLLFPPGGRRGRPARPIFYLSASFHETEEGFEHADPVPADVPPPKERPPLGEVLSKVSGRPISVWEREWGVLDVRVRRRLSARRLAERSGTSGAGPDVGEDDAPLPDERRLHQAALAYLSDLTLLSASTVPHGVFIGLNVQAASIDHAMWFHRPFRADHWLLYDQVSPSASSGLGLSTGRLFQDGVLIGSVAQEGLIRPLRKRP